MTQNPYHRDVNDTWKRALEHASPGSVRLVADAAFVAAVESIFMPNGYFEWKLPGSRHFCASLSRQASEAAWQSEIAEFIRACLQQAGVGCDSALYVTSDDDSIHTFCAPAGAILRSLHVLLKEPGPLLIGPPDGGWAMAVTSYDEVVFRKRPQ